MRVILFLGSGVSIPSGLPGVPQIRTALQNDPGQPRIQNLLDLLESIDRNYLKYSAPYEASRRVYRYTGQIYRADTTYEDLFDLASRISLNGCGLLSDVTVEAFSALVRKKGRRFLRGRTKIERALDLTKLAGATARFIEQVVADLLYGTTVQGLDLVLELAKSKLVDRLNIVTLNHDTLVEQAFAADGTRYVDGFGDQDGDVRWFVDRFPSSSKVWLIKPHGSISWYRFGDIKMGQPAVITNRNINEYKDAHGNQLRPESSTPSFLSGHGKVVSYNRGIFAHMQFRFQQALRESKLIIMSGYGWGDTPINFHLQYWLDRDRSNRIVLLHRNPSELVDRSKEMAEIYGAYTRSRRIVPIKKWLEHTSINEIEEFISHQPGASITAPTAIRSTSA